MVCCLPTYTIHRSYSQHANVNVDARLVIYIYISIMMVWWEDGHIIASHWDFSTYLSIYPIKSHLIACIDTYVFVGDDDDDDDDNDDDDDDDDDVAGLTGRDCI